MRSQNEISHIGPRQVGPFKGTAEDTADIMANLHKFGIGLDGRDVQKMMDAQNSGQVIMTDQAMAAAMAAPGGMDAALVGPLTTPSVNTPVQFLQAWLPGFVYILTRARLIDDLIGITTQGRWEDEQIVQGILERTGNTAVYGDLTNVPLSSWNINFETRTIVRFEEGLAVGRLEEARAAAVRVGSAEAKRGAAAEALEINRNLVGFFGFNSPGTRTFGFLNDPELISPVNAPTGTWSGAEFLDIVADIRSMYQGLRDQGQGRLKPGEEAVTLALPLSVYDALGITSDFGNSVLTWLKETYPNTRVIGVPELNLASGGLNLAVLYAEGVADESTDDSRTWVQVVPSKFQTLGVEQQVKRYVEDYSNATAGALLKRPFAVYSMDNV